MLKLLPGVIVFEWGWLKLCELRINKQRLHLARPEDCYSLLLVYHELRDDEE